VSYFTSLQRVIEIVEEIPTELLLNEEFIGEGEGLQHSLHGTTAVGGGCQVGEGQGLQHSLHGTTAVGGGCQVGEGEGLQHSLHGTTAVGGGCQVKQQGCCCRQKQIAPFSHIVVSGQTRQTLSSHSITKQAQATPAALPPNRPIIVYRSISELAKCVIVSVHQANVKRVC